MFSSGGEKPNNIGIKSQSGTNLTLLVFALGILSLTSIGIMTLSVVKQLRPVAFTAINKQLNYQGKLQNAAGITLTDGDYSMKFSIYAAASGGTPLWTECGTVGTPTARTVAVANGVFSVLLGDIASGACPGATNSNAITLDFNSDAYYLGLTVEADSEMTPRKRLGASGYAFNADLLDGLNTSAVGGSGAFVPVTDGSGHLTLTQNLTLGGVFKNADGSVGAPSYSFTNDLDTGLYWVSSGVMKFSANNADGSQFSSSGINANTINSLTAVTFTAKGQAVDGATAVGVTLGSVPTYSTAGAKLASFVNNTTEKAAIGLNGEVMAAQGTYLLPGLAFSGDENTGFYRYGAGIIGWTIDGAASGRLGNGYIRTAIHYAFEGGALTLLGSIADSAAIGVKIGNVNALTTSGAKIVSFYSDNVTTEKAYIDKDGNGYFPGANFSGLTASSAVYTDGSKNLTSTAPTTGAIGYWSRATTTLSPTTANDIVAITGNSGDLLTLTSTATGASNKALNISTTNATVGTDYGVYVSNNGAATTNVGLYATAAGATNNYAAIFDAGNVGIGTTTPGAKLHVVGTDAETLMILRGTNSSLKVATDSSGNGHTFLGTIGAHDLGFKTTDTVQMTIDKNGNVGIGTTAPQGTLDLGSGSNGKSIVWGGPTGVAHFASIGGAYSSASLSFLNMLKFSTSADQYLVSFTGSYPHMGLRFDEGTGDFIFFNEGVTSRTAGDVFDYATATKMTIKASGNVGIGDTSPDGKLDVEPTGAVTAASYGINLSNLTTNATTDGINKYGAYITSTGAWTGDAGAATNNYGLYVDTVSGGDNNYGAYFAQNVGIGTASPQARQHNLITSRSTAFNAADGATWHDLIIQNPDNTQNAAVGIAFELNGTYHANGGAGIAAVAGAGADYTADLAFITRPQSAVAAERMRITSTGNVGIGDTTPDASLEVVNDGTGDSFLVADTNDGDTTPFVIQSDGDVGIGTASPGEKLEVSGNTKMTGYLITQSATSNVIGSTSGYTNALLRLGGTVAPSGANANGVYEDALLTPDNGAVGVGWSFNGSWGAAEGDTIINVYGLKIAAAGKSGTGTITTGYGAYIDAPTAATTNYGLVVNTGNVGIGTTGPYQKLHVDSGAGSNLSALFQSAYGYNSILNIVENSGSALMYGGRIKYSGNDQTPSQVFQIGTVANDVETMAINIPRGSGNVGVNTTGPDRKLESLDASNPQLRLTYADNTTYADFQTTSNGDLVMNMDGASNQLVLDDGGNVGIGLANPSYKLDVAGTVNLPAGTWITATGINLVRSSNYGYSTTYKITQLGAAGTERGISLGADVSANASGNFAGNEIIIPNNIAMIAPNAANDNYLGVLRVGSDNKVYLGGATYATAGTMVLEVASSEVGIGTASPGSALDVRGEITGRLDSNQTAVNALSLQNLDNTATTLHGLGATFYLAQTGQTTALPSAKIVSGKEVEWTTTGSTNDSFLSFQTKLDGTLAEKVRIDSAGNVLINSLTASSLVYTDGSKNLTSTPPGAGSIGYWTRATTTLSPVTANDVVSITGNSGDLLTLTSTATGASNKALNIAASGATVGTDYGAYISNTGAATTNVGLYATTSGGTANYAAIFDAGNVGIGTATPRTKLEVNGVGSFSGVDDGVYIQENGAYGEVVGIDPGASAYNPLAIRTGASPSMYFDTSGNVGIGATTLGAKLVVGAATSTVPTGTVVAIAAANPRLSFSSNDADMTYGGYIKSGYTSGVGSFLLLGSQDATTDKNVLAITNGKAGIGTMSPNMNLEINAGATGINGQLLLANAGTYHTGFFATSDPANYLTNTYSWGLVGGPNSYLTGTAYTVGMILTPNVPRFQVTANATLNSAPDAGGYLLTVLRTGYVGIGTATPQAALHVAGTNDMMIGVAGSGGYGRFGGNVNQFFFSSNQYYDGSVRYSQNGGAGQINFDITTGATAGDITFKTAPSGTAGAVQTQTTRMVLTQAGLVGIGTDTTPDASLEVINDGSGDSFLVADTNDGDTTPFVIRSDGNVGIGTTNPTGAKLQIISSTDSIYGIYNIISPTIELDATQYDIGNYSSARQDVQVTKTNSGYAMGVEAEGYLSGAGNLAAAYGLRADSGTMSGGTGTITSAYGAYVRVLNAGGGTITSGYGLYLSDVAASTDYGVYQAGADDDNYFAGNVGIGTAPTYTLDVSSAAARGINAVTSNTAGAAVYGTASSSGATTNYGGYFVAAGTGSDTAAVYGSSTGTGGSKALYGGRFIAASATSGTSGVYGTASGAATVYGVQGAATDGTAVKNYGGYFTAAGTGALTSGVYGEASATGDVVNFGVHGKAAGNWGQGVKGEATATGATVNYGGYFTAAGVSGQGVAGIATSTGTNYGGYFQAAGQTGRAVYGYASSTTATVNYGGYFTSEGTGTGASGVFGTTAAAGTVYGVQGTATNATAVANYGGYFTAAGQTAGATGVYGEASGGADLVFGVHGVASGTGALTNYGGVFTGAGNQGRGVYGEATATGAYTNYGGYFTAMGDTGQGVHGLANATGSVTNYGGHFTAYGAGGLSAGVYAEASGAGTVYGVVGYASNTGAVTNYGGSFQAAGDTGMGVRGEATDSGAVANYGGYFLANGTGGAKGLYGSSTGASGTNYGVYGDVTSSTGYAGYFTGGYGLYAARGQIFRAPSGNDTLYSLVVDGATCIDDGTANCPGSPTSGTIYTEGAALQSFDLAELYESDEALVAGEVVSVDLTGARKILKSTTAYQETTMGVISTDPGITLGGWNAGPNQYPVALAGRVPVKVSDENGPIAIGDILTSSSTPGVAMKATRPGQKIGLALEAWSGAGQGVVEVFMAPGWDAASAIATDGTAIFFDEDFTFNKLGEADGTIMGYNSRGLTFRGSGWDGGAAQNVEMRMNNVVTDSLNYKLSVLNNAGSEIAYLDQDGAFGLSGKFYPATPTGAQNTAYIFYRANRMRTNAAGWATGSFDFAEMFLSRELLEAGDVVVLDETTNEYVKKSTAAYDKMALGIVSTEPGFLAGANVNFDDPSADQGYPIGLAGRVPTKVSAENGPIRPGDFLTTSATPGVAMKATESGMILGTALESFDGPGIGLVKVFVNLSWYNVIGEATPIGEMAQLTLTGDLNMAGNYILNVGKIVGVDEKWSIDENGVLKIKLVAEDASEKEMFGLSSAKVELTLSGTGRLENGTSMIDLSLIDPDFIKNISETTPIKVIVTLTEPANGVYVAEKSAYSFRVAELNAGTSDAAFDWIVIARRKGYEDSLAEGVVPPVEPAPAPPAPSEPAPSEPTPSEPAPSEPTPSEPAPAEPAPSDPAPETPPSEPAPETPAPEAPPAEPAPVEPPTEPAP